MILISKSISFYKRALPTPPTAGIQRSRPQAEIGLSEMRFRLPTHSRNAFAAHNHWFSIQNLYKSMVSASETRFRLPRHSRNAFAAQNLCFTIQNKTYINLWFRLPRRDFGFRDTLGTRLRPRTIVLLYKTYINLWFRLPKRDFGFRDTLGL
jgi:hypothetical protein